jgi:transposase-like protein
MAYSPEERAEVLEYYFNNDVSLRETIKRFGYPSLECISQWVENDPRYDEARFHKRVKYPYETRRAALKLLYEDELSFDEIALRLGIRNASSIADWKVAYEKGGMLALMPKNQMPKYSKDFKKKGKEPPEDIDELKARIEALQLENDVLRATLEVLKKDPGLSASDLTNREKVLVIDALRPRYRLSKLLTQLEIAKSSYHYAKASGPEARQARERAHLVKRDLRGEPENLRVSPTLVEAPRRGAHRQREGHKTAHGRRGVNRHLAEEETLWLLQGRGWQSSGQHPRSTVQRHNAEPEMGNGYHRVPGRRRKSLSFSCN